MTHRREAKEYFHSDRQREVTTGSDAKSLWRLDSKARFVDHLPRSPNKVMILLTLMRLERPGGGGEEEEGGE